MVNRYTCTQGFTFGDGTTEKTVECKKIISSSGTDATYEWEALNDSCQGKVTRSHEAVTNSVIPNGHSAKYSVLLFGRIFGRILFT